MIDLVLTLLFLSVPIVEREWRGVWGHWYFGIEVFKLELLPAWHLLVALCATVGTFGCLKLLDSIFPLLDLFRGCWLPYCGVLGFGVGVVPMKLVQGVRLQIKPCKTR